MLDDDCFEQDLVLVFDKRDAADAVIKPEEMPRDCISVHTD